MKFATTTAVLATIATTTMLGLSVETASAATFSSGNPSSTFGTPFYEQINDLSFNGSTYDITFGFGGTGALSAGATDVSSLGLNGTNFGNEIAMALNDLGAIGVEANSSAQPWFEFAVFDGTDNNARFSSGSLWSFVGTDAPASKDQTAWVIATQTTQAVPEPSTIIGSMAMLGLGATLLHKKRRQSAS